MKDLTDPTIIVEGLRLIAGVSDGPDPEAGESYDTMNELMTNAANTLERLAAERDQARAQAEQMVRQRDQANQVLSGQIVQTHHLLEGDLHACEEERDHAVAEAAVLREVLMPFDQYADAYCYPGSPVPDDRRVASTGGDGNSTLELVVGDLRAVRRALAHSPLAARAAAVLAEIAGWDQKPDVNPYGDSQGKLYDVWEKAQEYRAALAGQDVADDKPPSAREQA